MVHVVYSVQQYLFLLSRAKRSEKTIDLYRKTLKYYADFLTVDIKDLHLHLTVGNLTDYAGYLERLSPRGRQLSLSILHRYYKLNGVVIPELEANVIKQRAVREQNDKPLTLKSLQLMMDLANVREKAMITMLVSTGMRAGELAQLTVDDICGDIVRIPDAIAKGKHGGTAYLTAEAREYLDAWLKGRDAYKDGASRRHFSKDEMVEDDRLFLASYCSIKRAWVKLYDRVDGERGKYRAKCTLHSTRKYFRTNAVKTLDLDLVEKIMGHRGYLTDQYVRIPEDEGRLAFHEGEYILYITRPDDRKMNDNLDTLRREKEELEAALSERIVLMEKRMENLMGGNDKGK